MLAIVKRDTRGPSLYPDRVAALLPPHMDAYAQWLAQRWNADLGLSPAGETHYAVVPYGVLLPAIDPSLGEERCVISPADGRPGIVVPRSAGPMMLRIIQDLRIWDSECVLQCGVDGDGRISR